MSTKKFNKKVKTKPLDKERILLLLTKLKVITSTFQVGGNDSCMDNGYSLTMVFHMSMPKPNQFLLSLKKQDAKECCYVREIKGVFEQVWQDIENGTLVEREWITQWNKLQFPICGGLNGANVSYALLAGSRALSQQHNIHVIDPS